LKKKLLPQISCEIITLADATFSDRPAPQGWGHEYQVIEIHGPPIKLTLIKDGIPVTCIHLLLPEGKILITNYDGCYSTLPHHQFELIPDKLWNSKK
jgi:hypothetical protein